MDTTVEFLSHYGVPGMKWGHRKAKRLAKKDDKFVKNATSSKTTLAVYNLTADYMNKTGLNRLNNDPKFKDKDLTKDAKLMAAYNKKHEEIYTEAFKASANSMRSPSGKKQYDTKVEGDFLIISAKDVTHSDTGSSRVRLVRNKKGFVIKIIQEDVVLAQSSTSVDEFLEHYGVPGMKWGQRKASAINRNRQLNKASRKKDKATFKSNVSKAKETHAKEVDKARTYVNSGKAKADWKAAKAQYKKDKVEIGSREARKIKAKAAKKRIDAINKSQETRDGKELAQKIISDLVLGTNRTSDANWTSTYDRMFSER